jgi:hypothetical protein
LCEFLARADALEVVTFADQVDAWRAGPGTGQPHWRTSPWSRVLRVVENRTGYSRVA